MILKMFLSPSTLLNVISVGTGLGTNYCTNNFPKEELRRFLWYRINSCLTQKKNWPKKAKLFWDLLPVINWFASVLTPFPISITSFGQFLPVSPLSIHHFLGTVDVTVICEFLSFKSQRIGSIFSKQQTYCGNLEPPSFQGKGTFQSYGKFLFPSLS